MASKRRGNYRSGMPMEWVAVKLNATTTQTAYTSKMDLDLLQDEVAEILHIDSTFDVGGALPNVDEANYVSGLLSMDPDVTITTTPKAEAIFEDLETLFTHYWTFNTELAGAAATLLAIKTSDLKQWSHPGKPILVGTNIGMAMYYDSTTLTDVDWYCRVYFTRRKATVMELNQILLKRK